MLISLSSTLLACFLHVSRRNKRKTEYWMSILRIEFLLFRNKFRGHRVRKLSSAWWNGSYVHWALKIGTFSFTRWKLVFCGKTRWFQTRCYLVLSDWEYLVSDELIFNFEDGNLFQIETIKFFVRNIQLLIWDNNYSENIIDLVFLFGCVFLVHVYGWLRSVPFARTSHWTSSSDDGQVPGRVDRS